MGCHICIGNILIVIRVLVVEQNLRPPDADTHGYTVPQTVDAG